MNTSKPFFKLIPLVLTAALALVMLPTTAKAGGDMAMPGVYPTISANQTNLVIKADGSLWSLGYDFLATDYNWDWDNHGVKMIKIMDSVATVSCGSEYAMAVKTDGSLWGFGKVVYSESYYHGEDFGNVVIIDPTPFKIMDDAVSVSCGDYYTFAIKKDGSLWGWGNNDGGQIGIGTTEYVPYPVKIMDDVAQASASGYGNSMALKKDGTLWRWGYGVVDAQDQLTPRKIMDGVVAFSDSSAFRVIKTDASLWLCFESATPRDDIAGATYENGVISYKLMDDVVAVASMGAYTMPIKKDGSLWRLTDPAYAYDGVTETKIMDSVAQVSCGLATLAVKTDGSLWAWGANSYDWMGIGEGVILETPTKFMDGVKLAASVVQQPTSSAPSPAPVSAAITAKPTASTVYVDGGAKAFEAYTIEGNNYFKLRDLAAVLNGSGKQFAVGYDNATKAITLSSGQAYVAVGGEMTPGDGKEKAAAPTASKIFLDGKELNLTVYTINNNNFFKLRDLMEAIDVYVGYDNATKAITLDTSKGYTPE